jgi:hypothetical protein
MIYDPALGGDYLEFKKIECKGQACFAYQPSTTQTVMTDPGSPGQEAVYEDGGQTYIITQEYDPGQPEITEWITFPITVPVFEFNSNCIGVAEASNVGSALNALSIEAGLTSPMTWIQYYNYATGSDGIIPAPQPCNLYSATTGADMLFVQEPWLWNPHTNAAIYNYQLTASPLLVDSVSWSYADPFSVEFIAMQAVGTYFVPDMPNPDIIVPIGMGPALSFGTTNGDFDNDCYIMSNMCGSTGQELINWDQEFITQILNASAAGYIVGGPNNEYMWLDDGQIQTAEMQVLTDINGLPIPGYSYTGAPNDYSPNLSYLNMWGMLSNAQWDPATAGTNSYTSECVTNGGCWYAPNHAYQTTFDSTGEWIVTQEYIPPTEEEGYMQDNEDILVQEAIPAVDPTYETTGIPEAACFCAPGADKENFCTTARTFTVYLSEVANTDVILRDPLKNPSFEWCETFCTFQSRTGNVPAIRIWRKNFFIMEPTLYYYRTPRRIEIAGSIDPYTGELVAADIECEFKDDIVELLIDNGVSILAGDIDASNQMMRGEESSEKNN